MQPAAPEEEEDERSKKMDGALAERQAVRSVGVVGCGYWGKNYVRIMHQLRLPEPVCVCDMNETLVAQTLVKYPTAHAYTDLDMMLAETALDVRAIAYDCFVFLHLPCRR